MVAAVGDYAASKITNDAASAPGAHVSDALDALLSEYPRGTYNIGAALNTLDFTNVGKLGLITAPGPGGADLSIPLGGTAGLRFDVLIYASGSNLSISTVAGVNAHNLTLQSTRYLKVSLECIATNEWMVSWVPH